LSADSVDAGDADCREHPHGVATKTIQAIKRLMVNEILKPRAEVATACRRSRNAVTTRAIDIKFQGKSVDCISLATIGGNLAVVSMYASSVGFASHSLSYEALSHSPFRQSPPLVAQITE
jgi:hypothetical protein